MAHPRAGRQSAAPEVGGQRVCRGFPREEWGEQKLDDSLLGGKAWTPTTKVARFEPKSGQAPGSPSSVLPQCSEVTGLACLPLNLYCMSPRRPLTVDQALGTCFCQRHFCLQFWGGAGCWSQGGDPLAQAFQAEALGSPIGLQLHLHNLNIWNIIIF